MELELLHCHRRRRKASQCSFLPASLSVRDYDRPLEKNELLGILDIEAIEFELLLVNDILRPSISIEYHPARFLGFFTYWDCIAVKIYQSLLKMGMHIDDAAAQADDIISCAIELLSTMPLSTHAEAAETSRQMSAIINSVISTERGIHFSEISSLYLEILIREIRDVQERFWMAVAEEARCDFSPFSIEVSEFGVPI